MGSLVYGQQYSWRWEINSTRRLTHTWQRWCFHGFWLVTSVSVLFRTVPPRVTMRSSCTSHPHLPRTVCNLLMKKTTGPRGRHRRDFPEAIIIHIHSVMTQRKVGKLNKNSSNIREAVSQNRVWSEHLMKSSERARGSLRFNWDFRENRQ